MRAHFPPLGVAHAKRHSVRAAWHPRRGADPRNLRWRARGRAGAGRGGATAAGHGWASGPICERHAHRRRLSSERTGPACGGPARRTAAARVREEAGGHRCPAWAGEAGSGQGTGQGESTVRSGDGRAWAADTPSHQRRERGSNTHARLRTKRTGEQTHRHTRQWTQPDRHRETRGSVWAALVACLSMEDWSETVECSTRGCKVGAGWGLAI